MYPVTSQRIVFRNVSLNLQVMQNSSRKAEPGNFKDKRAAVSRSSLKAHINQTRIIKRITLWIAGELLRYARLFFVRGYVSGMAGEESPPQVIRRAGTQSSRKQTNTFTGDVRSDPLISSSDGSQFTSSYVTFEPGARSFWHVHPAGQHLIVVFGTGWRGTWDGDVSEIKVGDVVWCPPGAKHWHGASPATAMTHLTITGSLDGKNVEWMEEVTEDQYQK